jgi:biotin operon repressor
MKTLLLLEQRGLKETQEEIADALKISRQWVFQNMIQTPSKNKIYGATQAT